MSLVAALVEKRFDLALALLAQHQQCMKCLKKRLVCSTRRRRDDDGSWFEMPLLHPLYLLSSYTNYMCCLYETEREKEREEGNG